jgi:ferrous iron transport protein B
MVNGGMVFVTEAGKIILAISIVLWFLASYPKVDVETLRAQTTVSEEIDEATVESSLQLRNSYAGKIGRFIEPVIEPLGFDWKIGIGLITAFAAREVMVGTLNTIYSVQESDDSVVTLKQKLINDKNLETGKSVYSTLTALSLMVFFALAMQCMSTVAIVKRETNSWKWALVMVAYMTITAYLSSLLVFQVGTYMGWGV